MKRTYTNRRYLDALQERILIFDGAMGTNLQAQKLSVAQFGGEKTYGCNDYLVISYPQAVEKVHRSFLEIGVDAIETDTFRATRFTLGKYGLEDRVVEINLAAARLASRLAREYSTPTHPVFVGGSIGPTGKLPSMDDPDLSATFDELVDVFYEQALGLVQGDVDLLVVETSQDVLEVKAAIAGIQKVFKETGVYLPIQAQVTLDTSGRMLLGTDVSAALVSLEGLPIDVIGLNCSTGPEHMRQPIQYLGENANLPISCIPNAGLPVNVDGEAVYTLEPEPYVDALVEFVEQHRVSVVGGCCGTTPAHIQPLVERLHGRPRSSQPQKHAPYLASRLRAVPLQVEQPPLIIGAACDPDENPEYQRLLLEEDYDGILDLARGQVKAGAQAICVSADVPNRDQRAGRMEKTARKLTMGLRVPLAIASTDPEVMEVALKVTPGRCLLVLDTMEYDQPSVDQVFRLAKQYNAAVLCQSLDETGPAKTAEHKLDVLRHIYRIAVNEYDLHSEDLVFDPFTFPLVSSDSAEVGSAMQTLEAIRLLKQTIPEILSALKISRVSSGLALKARVILDSVYLHYAVQAGLDIAFINPSQITPYAEIPPDELELAKNLLFNRSPDALDQFVNLIL